MRILSRIIRLCKADLHGVMDQMENKQLLLKQHLREMQTVLDERQIRIHQLETEALSAQKDLTGYARQAEGLEEDLNRAIAKGKEDIARMLIRKLHPLRRDVESLTRHLNNLKADLAEEREHLTTQRLAYDEARQRVAAAREGFGQVHAPMDIMLSAGSSGSPPPSEEEIEWELIQRKEALASGRST